MQTLRTIILASLLLLVVTPVWGRVFVEWTEPAVPSAASLGVKDLVIPWGPDKIQLMNTAKERGYRVYARVKAQDAGAAVRGGLAGIIVEDDSSEPGQGTAQAVVQKLRNSYPGISFLVLDPGGKQPQIMGNMVQKKRGVLVVSSPTRAPWIDSNVALARFERAFQPGQPPLFSFSWDLTDPLEKKLGPRAEDYALTVAEAGALHADVVLSIHPNLQKGLAERDKAAWREWDRVKTYLSFYSKERNPEPQPVAEVAVVTDHYEDAYEAMNLMARHNITFRVLSPNEVTAQGLSGSRMVIMFSHPDAQAAHALQVFSAAGGTVLVADPHGPSHWEPLPAVKASDGASYKIERGQTIESSQVAGDPGAFAEKVRNLLRGQGPLIYVWNAVTTLAFAYRAPQAGGMVLDLVNYAQEPLQVQVRVKGSFPSIRYETPEHGFYPALTPEIEHGFTQFVVSHLEIGARVYLSPKAKPTE
jgi:hypothetical protein